MGSYSSSNTSSNTSYVNKPVTLSDNALSLENSSNNLLGSGNILGNFTSNLSTSTDNTKSNSDNFSFLSNTNTNTNTTTLDGGVIGSAFGFSSDIVRGFFQAQKDNNAMISASNRAALDFSSKAQDLVDKNVNVETQKNTSITRNLMIAAAVAIAFFYFKRG